MVLCDLQVNKHLSPKRVASAIGLSVEEVRAAKQKIVEMIQAVKRLEEKMV